MAYTRGVTIVGALLGVLFLAAFAVGFLQVGFHISPERLEPKFDKLNPTSGFQRLFSVGAVVKGVPVVQVALDESDRPALRAALAVLAALPTPVRATVTAVTASSPEDVQLRVGASTVVWGSPERSERKAAIYAALRRTPATVYDLSSPETPVLR